MERKRKKVNRKEGRVEIRVELSEKQCIRKLADEAGLTMSEFIVNLILNRPQNWKAQKQEKFAAVRELSKELNYIGHNINQLTVAIRQINAERRIEDGQYRRLERELQKFNSKRDEVADLLLKKMF